MRKEKMQMFPGDIGKKISPGVTMKENMQKGNRITADKYLSV